SATWWCTSCIRRCASFTTSRKSGAGSPSVLPAEPRSRRRRRNRVPRLSVLAVSARLPGWAEQACAEYAKRMPKGYEVARIPVRNEAALRSALPRNARLVALDERGKDYGTRAFAGLLESETAFVIGGPDGLSEEVKHGAALVLRVSSFTL